MLVSIVEWLVFADKIPLGSGVTGQGRGVGLGVGEGEEEFCDETSLSVLPSSTEQKPAFLLPIPLLSQIFPWQLLE